MKNIRKGTSDGNKDLPDTVIGAEAEQGIAEMFKESYENLFNSAPSGAEMETMKVNLETLIDVAAKDEVNKVTGDIVREAVSKLKPRKTDVSGGYISDALKLAPELLFDQLAV